MEGFNLFFFRIQIFVERIFEMKIDVIEKYGVFDEQTGKKNPVSS